MKKEREYLPIEKAMGKRYSQGIVQSQRKKEKTMFRQEAEYTMGVASSKSRISEETGRVCGVGDG